MPNKEEHCKHTLSRYGVTGEDIHEWMDEPSLIMGPEHRDERHDPKQSLPQKFVEKYGEELARNIMLDHIFLDVKSVRGIKSDSVQPSQSTGFETYEPKLLERANSPSISRYHNEYSVWIPITNEYYEKMLAILGETPQNPDMLPGYKRAFDISYDSVKRAILLKKGSTLEAYEFNLFDNIDESLKTSRKKGFLSRFFGKRETPKQERVVRKTYINEMGVEEALIHIVIDCGEIFFTKIAYFRLRNNEKKKLEYEWSDKYQGLIIYLEREIL